MKEKTYVEDIDRSLYDFRNEEKDAYKVKEALASEGFRVEVDARNEKLGYRIREAQLKKIPVEIVVGDGEIAEGSVNIRRFGVQGNTSMKLEDAIALFKDEVKKFTC